MNGDWQENEENHNQRDDEDESVEERESSGSSGEEIVVVEHVGTSAASHDFPNQQHPSCDPPVTPNNQEPDHAGDGDTETRIPNFVIVALQVVECTFDSISNCAKSFQDQFGHDAHYAELCLKWVAHFFLGGDPTSRLNTFYVIHHLIQSDSRFRLPTLSSFLPRVYWAVSSLAENEPYMKSVAVWEERKIYPPEVCACISRAFQAANVTRSNADEFVSRLESFAWMSHIRAAKDFQLENVFKTGDDDDTVATAAAIMAASPSELRAMGQTARSSLELTQGLIEYLSRLLLDFDDGLRTSNIKSMKLIFQILELVAPDSRC